MFSKRLRELRKDNKLTQEELGNILKVTNVAVAEWESDDIFPDKDLLLQIADYFNVSIDYLLGRSNNFNENNLAFELKEKNEQLKKATEIILNANKDLQSLITKAREEERIKLQEEIQLTSYNYNKVLAEKENLANEKKELLIKYKKEISSREQWIGDRLGKLDLTKDIMNLCSEIENEFGGKLSNLTGMYCSINKEIDDISKKRIEGTLLVLKHQIEHVLNKIDEDDVITENYCLNKKNINSDKLIKSAIKTNFNFD